MKKMANKKNNIHITNEELEAFKKGIGIKEYDRFKTLIAFIKWFFIISLFVAMSLINAGIVWLVFKLFKVL